MKLKLAIRRLTELYNENYITLTIYNKSLKRLIKSSNEKEIEIIEKEIELYNYENNDICIDQLHRRK